MKVGQVNPVLGTNVVPQQLKWQGGGPPAGSSRRADLGATVAELAARMAKVRRPGISVPDATTLGQLEARGGESRKNVSVRGKSDPHEPADRRLGRQTAAEYQEAEAPRAR